LMVTALFLADKCVAALGEEPVRQAKR